MSSLKQPAFHWLWNRTQPQCIAVRKTHNHIIQLNSAFICTKFIGVRICSFFYILYWKLKKKNLKKNPNCIVLCTMLQITHIKSFFLFKTGMYKGKIKNISGTCDFQDFVARTICTFWKKPWNFSLMEEKQFNY